MIVDRWKKLQSYIATRIRLGGLLPNDGYLTGVPKIIDHQFTKVNSSGAGPDTLHTYTMPKKTVKPGDLVEIWAGGGFAANDTDKFIHGEFGNIIYENGGAVDIDGLGWVLCTRVGIVDLTHITVSHFVVFGVFTIASDNVTIGAFNIGGFFVSRSNDNVAINDMDANDTVIRVRSVCGAGAAANDVFQNMSEIKLTRF